MKVLALFFSFFSFSNAKLVSKEVEYVDSIYNYKDYYVLDNDEYELYFKEQLIRTYNKGTSIKIIEVNQKIYVFSIYKNILSIEEYNHYHSLISEKNFLDKFYDEFNVYYENNKLYFIGGIVQYKSDQLEVLKKDYFNNIDAIIFTLDSKLDFKDLYIYGGELNEYFLEAGFYNKDIYLTIIKDALTGGDFGYGGGNGISYCFCRLNNSFEIVKYVTFMNESIFDFRIDEEIIIATDSNMYRLDYQLNLNESVKFPFKSIFTHLAFNNSLLVFGESEAKYYDLKKRNYICDISYPDINLVKIINDAYVIKDNESARRFKIYDTRNIPNLYVYRGTIFKGVVSDMFKEIEIEDVTISPHFNPLIYGDYQAKYLFDGLNYQGIIHVDFEANVSDDLIYPLRYNLKFTGTALLNDIQIMNNHSITNPGEYQLKLIGCNNETKTIVFSVASNQISFIEPANKNWDIVVNKESELILQIVNPNDQRFEVISAWINNESYACIVEKELIKIKITPEEAGVHNYNLQAITYLYDNKIYDYEINNHYIVNVLRDEMNVYTEVTSDNKNLNFFLEIDDPFDSLRGINVIHISNGRENRYSYPITNSKFSLPNTINGGEAIIKIAYDCGDGVIKELEIFKAHISNFSNSFALGELNILEMGKSNLNLLIVLYKNKAIESCEMNEDIIYRYQANDYTPYYSSGLFIGIAVYLFVKGIRKRKLRK